MEEKAYKELLEKAYAELPEVLYKKERFEVPQVKGKLIRSRTVISNFKEIAKYLSRDTPHFSRFVLKDLGVRGEVDEREGLILHSRFQPGILNRAVSRYFKTYVECSHCNSPDTELNSEYTEKKCKACGFTEKVNKV
jgi:translation initiation factor 2 subunit 2